VLGRWPSTKPRRTRAKRRGYISRNFASHAAVSSGVSAFGSSFVYVRWPFSGKSSTSAIGSTGSAYFLFAAMKTTRATANQSFKVLDAYRPVLMTTDWPVFLSTRVRVHVSDGSESRHSWRSLPSMRSSR